jgi:putative oxidoreductase
MPLGCVEGSRGLNTIKLGSCVQRLYSTFPNGWPGVGLFLLRLCLGLSLIWFAVVDLSGTRSESIGTLPDFAAAAGGLSLLAGLWTPIIGALIATGEVWIAYSVYQSRLGDAQMRVILAMLSLSIAMLGPGAWSVDAHLFGRKRLDVVRRRGRKTIPLKTD